MEDSGLEKVAACVVSVVAALCHGGVDINRLRVSILFYYVSQSQ